MKQPKAAPKVICHMTDDKTTVSAVKNDKIVENNKIKTLPLKKLFMIFLVFCALLSCKENKENDHDKFNDPFRKNLINPLYLDQLFTTPNAFGSVWLSEHVKLLDIDKISIVLKGGNKPDNVLEKYIYTFNKYGQSDTFKYYFYNNSKEALNETNMSFSGNSLSKIDVIKYFGVGNLPPVLVTENKKAKIFYRSKSNNKNDSLFFFPDVKQPSIIIDKIGNFYNSVEVIVPKGSSSTEIMNQLMAVDPNLTNFDLAEKLLTYTENGYPLESYHLGENWNQMELAKQWEYNTFMQPTHFTQWIHGTKIKDIEIVYNENALPKKITYNRKKYYLIYKKM